MTRAATRPFGQPFSPALESDLRGAYEAAAAAASGPVVWLDPSQVIGPTLTTVQGLSAKSFPQGADTTGTVVLPVVSLGQWTLTTYWAFSVTSGEVDLWVIGTTSVVDGVLNAGGVTESNKVIDVPGASNILWSWTTNLNLQGSLGDLLRLQIQRLGATGNDTMAGTAYLLGALLQYP